ncbi:hypothetical protein M9458_055092 [Cirrhinus mrigala]|uniref:Uncharacterized protein n=1 Tax=Cirrhinus mrigala TaxID=683832 RepID=A0ABD0MKS8_CIRMR
MEITQDLGKSWPDAALGACFLLGLDDEMIRCVLPVCNYPLIELINLILYLNCSDFEVEEIEDKFQSQHPAPSEAHCVAPAHPTPPTARTACPKQKPLKHPELHLHSQPRVRRLSSSQACWPQLSQACWPPQSSRPGWSPPQSSQARKPRRPLSHDSLYYLPHHGSLSPLPCRGLLSSVLHHGLLSSLTRPGGLLCLLLVLAFRKLNVVEGPNQAVHRRKPTNITEFKWFCIKEWAKTPTC